MSEPVVIRRWAKLLDQTRCIGCHACSTACKSENGVPLGVHRTYVKLVEAGRFPAVRRAFQVTRCNQCDAAPCTTACPTRAMYRRRDGIVDFDKAICIGCKACIAACPYDAIFINPDDGAAEKCNLCSHRLDAGLEPACVTVCPTNAIVVGDLDDQASPLAERLAGARVRKPEKQTRPKVFYQGATEATLDPLAARRPDGGLYLWAEQPAGPHSVAAGHPTGAPTSSAAALLAYDVAHHAPWDWRVSLYTWTKGIAAGVYLVALLLLGLGALDPAGEVWRWRVPAVAAGFLALTGGLLLADLEHPERFLLIFTRRHMRSWLVRGALAITAYGAWLAVHLVWAFTAAPPIWLAAIAGVPLAGLTAVYTAFLFAQARARDLWQSRLLAPHLAVQAITVGAAAMIVVEIGAPGAPAAAAWLLAAASAVHLALIAAEVMRPHTTEHARLAVRAMTSGRLARAFWAGVALAAAGLAAPWLPVPAAIAALAGMVCFEHAHVQAGQIVPLA